MKTIPIMVPPKTPAPPAKKPRRDQSASPKVKAISEDENQALKRNVLHDVVNQLTIISLACFELRTPECEPWNASQRKAIEAIETAVQNAGELAVQLAKTFEVESSTKTRDLSPSRSLPTNNVYPISPYLTRR